MKFKTYVFVKNNVTIFLLNCSIF